MLFLSQIVCDRSHVDCLFRASACCSSRVPSCSVKTPGSRSLYPAFGHRAKFGTTRSENPFHSNGRGKWRGKWGEFAAKKEFDLPASDAKASKYSCSSPVRGCKWWKGERSGFGHCEWPRVFFFFFFWTQKPGLEYHQLHPAVDARARSWCECICPRSFSPHIGLALWRRIDSLEWVCADYGDGIGASEG